MAACNFCTVSNMFLKYSKSIVSCSTAPSDTEAVAGTFIAEDAFIADDAGCDAGCDAGAGRD